MSQIVIVSGPPGSGKSAVCESLCERYDRTVHLYTDHLYEWIRMGFVSPWKPESARQNETIARAAARAATAYAQSLYAVFIDGVIGPHLLPLYLEELRPADVPVHFVRLMPTEETIVRRGLDREEAVRVPKDLLRRGFETFEQWGDFAGVTIDNSTMTPDLGGDAVQEACGTGAALVWSPG
jgi:chloramphenicol 3-O-phosphotransferase